MWTQVLSGLSLKIQLRCLEEVPGSIAWFVQSGNVPFHSVPRVPQDLSHHTTCRSALHYFPAGNPSQTVSSELERPFSSFSTTPRLTGQIDVLTQTLARALIPRAQPRTFCQVSLKSQSLEVVGLRGLCWVMSSGSHPSVVLILGEERQDYSR